jgi:hypothetical protein
VGALYMEVLETAALPIVTPGTHSASFKAAAALSTALAQLVQSCFILPFSVPNQIRLAIALTRLRVAVGDMNDGDQSLSPNYRALSSIITDRLTSAIVDACQKLDKYAALHNDLQVSTLYKTRSPPLISGSLHSAYGYPPEIGHR